MTLKTKQNIFAVGVILFFLLLFWLFEKAEGAGESPYYGIQQNTATGRAAGHISGTWGVAASSQAPGSYTVFLNGVTGEVSAEGVNVGETIILTGSTGEVYVGGSVDAGDVLARTSLRIRDNTANYFTTFYGGIQDHNIFYYLPVSTAATYSFLRFHPDNSLHWFDINATGALSNLAYKGQDNNFSTTQTFQSSGTFAGPVGAEQFNGSGSGLSDVVLSTSPFGGDASGTYDNLSVADDSHNHGAATITSLDVSIATGTLSETSLPSTVLLLSGRGGQSIADNIHVDGNLKSSGTVTALGGFAGELDGNAATVTDGVYTSRSIGTTAPLSGGGDFSANRTLAISSAGATSDGYLKQADWNTFNDKRPAGAVDWTDLQNYPAACSAGQFVNAVGDTLTCATPEGGGTGGNAYTTGGVVGAIPYYTEITTFSASSFYRDNANSYTLHATSFTVINASSEGIRILGRNIESIKTSTASTGITFYAYSANADLAGSLRLTLSASSTPHMILDVQPYYSGNALFTIDPIAFNMKGPLQIGGSEVLSTSGAVAPDKVDLSTVTTALAGKLSDTAAVPAALVDLSTVTAALAGKLSNTAAVPTALVDLSTVTAALAGKRDKATAITSADVDSTVLISTKAIPVDIVDSSTGTPNARNINTTAPIYGGGDLSADRTLSLGAISGAYIESFDAAKATGTLADARLSSNVALKNQDNNWSAAQTFQSSATITATATAGLRVSSSAYFATAGGGVAIGATSTNFPLLLAPAAGLYGYPDGTSGTKAFMRFYNSGYTSIGMDFGIWGTSPYGGWIQARDIGTGNVPLLLNPLGGNVGISTGTPQVALDVGGTIRQATAKSCSNGVVTDANGSFTGCVSSDENLKEDIADVPITGEEILSLRPVKFHWRESAPAGTDRQEKFGFIAQEVEEFLPAAVSVDGQGMKNLDYNAIVAALVKLVQQQQAEINRLNQLFQ